MTNKRINIFTGHFGSGKSEIAINFVLELSKLKQKTAIADLDIVNPFFRTADVKDKLKEKGIWVITPLFANTNTDVPALPPELYTVFGNKDYNIVLDIGGDDLGAKVVSRYREEIVSDDWEMFFVVNAKRPMTDTVDKTIKMLRDIEESSRLKVTSLVNNTNLLEDTTPEVLLEGHEMLSKVSERTGIPISLTCGYREVLLPLSGSIKTNFLFLKKTLLLPWQ